MKASYSMELSSLGACSNSDKFSFIRARDPSILAWNRPALNPDIRTALTELDSQTISSTDISEDIEEEQKNIQVYLRIKPTDNPYQFYEIKDNQTLLCRVPDSSQSFRNLKDADKIYKFSFTKIYGPDTSQEEVFNDCVKGKVLNCINGKNSTIFTYGASGSGKTYTILGDANNPGIIPRALEYLFRTMPPVEDLPTIKIFACGNVEVLDKVASREERLIRHNILNTSLTNADKTLHTKTYKAMQQRLSSEPSGSLLEDFSHVSLSVWVSFAEVYNEYVYDLLQPEPPRGRLRAKLPLGMDNNGKTYIKNLRHISVSSGVEAYSILQYGMHNLNYASTALNQHSSRSHFIFTLKLVQTLSSGSEVQISHINFCDLAGSERTKISCSKGDRLKESSNINTSLHVLGRCIKTIKEAQKYSDSRLIPYRESKLTRLFQPALSGQEAISMIVNMNPAKNMFDESQHVLNFSAIAKDVTIEIAPKPSKVKIKNRFSDYMETKKINLFSINESEDTDVSFLRDKVDYLSLMLETEKNNSYERELEIRREVTTEFQNFIEEMKKQWETRLAREKKQAQVHFERLKNEIEHYYQNLITEVISKPRLSEVIDLTDEETKEDVTVTKLQFELKLKDKEIQKLKDDYKELQTQYNHILNKDDTYIQNILEDARVKYLEVEEEKNQLEVQYKAQLGEIYKYQEEIAYLNEQLSAQAVEQLEKVEYVEHLEEQLNRTLGDIEYEDDLHFMNEEVSK